MSESSSDSEPSFYGVKADIIYGQVNAYKYLNPQTPLNFSCILNNLRETFYQQLSAANFNDLAHYYQDTLKLHDFFIDNFIIQSIQKIKGEHALVDWRGFPPSSPHDESSWINLEDIPKAVLREYIQQDVARSQLEKVLSSLNKEKQGKYGYIFEMIAIEDSMVFQNNFKLNRYDKEEKVDLPYYKIGPVQYSSKRVFTQSVVQDLIAQYGQKRQKQDLK